MRYQFVPYLSLSMIMIVMMLALTVFAWKRRSVRGVPFFLMTLILVTVWITAQAMEIAAVSLSDKLFWANIQHFSVNFIPISYFYLALSFVGNKRLLKLHWLPIMLIAVAAAVNVLFWTNDYHGLLRQNVHLDTNGPIPVVAKTYGPVFWAMAVYNFLFSLFTLMILIKGLRKRTRQYKAQSVSLILGLLLPACSVGLYISGLTGSRIDPTPLVIGLSGLIIAWSIFRYKLFDIVRIAYSTIVHEMDTGMIIIDNKDAVVEINPAAKEMLGLPPEQPTGLHIQALLNHFPRLITLYDKKTAASDEIVIHNNDVVNYYEVTLKQLGAASDTPLGWIMQLYNITRRKLEEEKILFMASCDALTGLLNRGHFQRRFREELDHARKTGASFAIAYMDLDDFKQINDSYGHEVGDAFLREVADRLKTILRDSDIIARYGGDEYVILFTNIRDDETLKLISEKIFRAFAPPFYCGSHALQIKASIGFSVYPRDGVNLDMLISRADKAMYAVKSGQKNASHIYRAAEPPAVEPDG